MKSSYVRVSPNSNENVPMRDRKGHKDTRGIGHERWEQTGVMWPQAKECQDHKLEVARKEPPLEPSEEKQFR